jgi:serine/threonine-protein kinase
VRILRVLVAPDVPEPVDADRYRLVARARLVITLLFCVGNVSKWMLGARIQGLDRVAYGRFIAVTVPLMALVAAASIWSLRPGRSERALRSVLLISLVPDTLITLAALWVSGSLTSWNFGLMLVQIAAYRVALDARIGLFVLVSSIIGHIGLVALEAASVLPSHAAFPARVYAEYATVPSRVTAFALLFVLELLTWMGAGWVAYVIRKAQHALRQANEGLSQRVQEQVVEIVARAKQVEALNAELRQKVQERSRELAEALRRLGNQAPTDSLPAGTVVAERARIIRPIGKGGMGAVYLAEDLVGGGSVAVKFLQASTATDKSALQRFVAEAAAAAAVDHPGIVKTLHVDVTADGQLFQIMEYVPGVTVAQWLLQKRASAAEAARIGCDIARALAAAHRVGVIHRDIKPSNVILSTVAPGVRIVDFGLSKIVERELEQSATGVTRTRDLLGTPAYMSPEQVRDASRVTAATDVYSLGVVLYLMLAGKLPYPDAFGPGVYVAHLTDEPRALGTVAPDAPAALAEIVHRCLSKRADERPTAGDLVFHLTHLADDLGARLTVDIARDGLQSMAADTTPS